MLKKLGIGLGTLVIALVVFGQIMTYLTRRNVPAIQEAAVRYLLEPGAADPTFSQPGQDVIFLRIGQGDPSPQLLARLANTRVPVVAASEGQPESQGFGPRRYAHRTSGKSGPLLFLGRVRSTNTTSATIDFNAGRLELKKDGSSWQVVNTYMGMAG